MRRILATFLALGLVVASRDSFVIAQGPSEAWKQQNKLGDRYEGMGFERDVGAPALELVSFYGYREEFDPAVDASLTVDFFSWQRGPYTLVGREISAFQNYWLETRAEATAGVNEWSGWSTQVLKRAKPPIDPTNVGLVIRLDAGEAGGKVAPAILRRRGSPLPRQISEYEATFMPDRNLAEVSFRVLEGCDPGAVTRAVEPERLGNQDPGIKVFIPVKPSRPGLTTLKVDYTVEGKAAPTLDYCFWHVPDPRDPRPIPGGAR